VWRAANRLTNMVDGIGTTHYSYDAMGLLTSEDGPWANHRVSYVNLANKTLSSVAYTPQAYQGRVRSLVLARMFTAISTSSMT